VAETSLACGLAARSSPKRQACWHWHRSMFRSLMHRAKYSELAGRTRQGVGMSLLSSSEDGERYYRLATCPTSSAAGTPRWSSSRERDRYSSLRGAPVLALRPRTGVLT
jgi:hypothetical protein